MDCKTIFENTLRRIAFNYENVIDFDLIKSNKNLTWTIMSRKQGLLSEYVISPEYNPLWQKVNLFTLSMMYEYGLDLFDITRNDLHAHLSANYNNPALLEITKIIINLHYHHDQFHNYDLLSYSKFALDRASEFGNIQMLQWWLNEYITFRALKQLQYTDALNLASRNGHIEVLNWWLQLVTQQKYRFACIELKHSCDAIDLASRNGHIAVLDWWLQAFFNNLIESLLYSNKAIAGACVIGRVEVLDWWLQARIKHRIKLLYDNDAINLASANGHVRVLEWWLQTHINQQVELPMLYTEDALIGASCNGQIRVLNWWKRVNQQYKLEMKYPKNILKTVPERHRAKITKWWQTSGFPIE
jgi:hypothetical protein